MKSNRWARQLHERPGSGRQQPVQRRHSGIGSQRQQHHAHPLTHAAAAARSAARPALAHKDGQHACIK